MYELIQVGERTYYIDAPTRLGLFCMEDGEKVCLIDSGLDKSTAKKVLKLLEEKGWSLEYILNTHSHADHIGGNCYLQEKTGCGILVPPGEQAFVENPLLEPVTLFAGCPPRVLRNKYLMAQGSQTEPLMQAVLPEGLEMIALPGHSLDLTGFRAEGDIVFLGDCLTGEDVLQKHPVSYLYNLADYLDTLDKVEQMEGRMFIPAHAKPREDIKELVAVNRKAAQDILTLVEEACYEESSFEDILKRVFDHYNVRLDFSQYFLSGSTIRSYLSYLMDAGRVGVSYEDNRLIWRRRREIETK